MDRKGIAGVVWRGVHNYFHRISINCFCHYTHWVLQSNNTNLLEDISYYIFLLTRPPPRPIDERKNDNKMKQKLDRINI